MDNRKDLIELKLEALALGGREAASAPLEACPDDETFAAFMQGTLPQKDTDRWRAHAARCPDCVLAITAWRETEGIEGPPVPAHLLVAARRLVKKPVTRLVLELFDRAFRILNPGDVRHQLVLNQSASVTRGEGGDERHESVELHPEVPGLEAIRIQHLEHRHALKVTLVVDPKLDEEQRKRLRVDVYSDVSLIQSWPLYLEGTSLNPLEKGVYRLSVMEIEPSSDQHQFRTLGTVELDLKK